MRLRVARSLLASQPVRNPGQLYVFDSPLSAMALVWLQSAATSTALRECVLGSSSARNAAQSKGELRHSCNTWMLCSKHRRRETAEDSKARG